MAYDPMQYAAMRSQIAGRAAGDVSSALKTSVMALGQFAEMKDKEDKLNKGYPELLRQATARYMQEAGIDPTDPQAQTAAELKMRSIYPPKQPWEKPEDVVQRWANKESVFQDLVARQKAETEKAKAAQRQQGLQNIYSEANTPAYAPIAGKELPEGVAGPVQMEPVAGTEPGTNEEMRAVAAGRVNAWGERQVAQGEKPATLAETTEAQMVAAPKLSEQEKRLQDAAKVKAEMARRDTGQRGMMDKLREWELAIKQGQLDLSKTEYLDETLANAKKAKVDTDMLIDFYQDQNPLKAADLSKDRIDIDRTIKEVQAQLQKQKAKTGIKPEHVREVRPQPAARKALLYDASGNLIR